MIDRQLRKAIEASGMTAYALAKDAGIRPELITRFLSGERDLRLASAAKVAAALRMSLVVRKSSRAAR